MSRPLLRCAGSGVAACLVALLCLDTCPPADAETCLSPFVKRLDRPEKYLYVYCVDADAKDNDFLLVVATDRKSKQFGKAIHKLDLGSKGNETHHFGFTDDRTHIWGLTLFSNRAFLIDVATDPARPRLKKVFENFGAEAGLSSPHTAYALPGRMLISFLSSKDGGLPTGLAEFTTAGKFVRKLALPKDAPYGYDVAVKPDRNRMVTSSFTYFNNYRNPLAKMDMTKFGKELLVWDFRNRKVLQKLTTGAAPLECRWSLKEGADHGFTNCALDNSIWVWQGQSDGKYTTRKLCDTGKLPVDLRQSPDDRFLYVSCFFSDEIQQWDVSDLKKVRLNSTLKNLAQPNMMHVTGDGQRMYITNSLLSTIDRPARFWIKLAAVGSDGMKLVPDFDVDLNNFPTGPARGHDMLLN
ncbi:MAG: selenium-binding protein [Gemmataceae bacterium]|nr:selenium-binding protein [Gemmataceae bacterium]